MPFPGLTVDIKYFRLDKKDLIRFAVGSGVRTSGLKTVEQGINQCATTEVIIKKIRAISTNACK